MGYWHLHIVHKHVNSDSNNNIRYKMYSMSMRLGGVLFRTLNSYADIEGYIYIYNSRLLFEASS